MQTFKPHLTLNDSDYGIWFYSQLYLRYRQLHVNTNLEDLYVTKVYIV